MMKTIKDTFPNLNWADLPKAAFGGRIVCIQTEVEANKAVDYLMMQSRVGVDTETRPSFVSGRVYKVALVQVSTLDICFLFRFELHRLSGFPETFLGRRPGGEDRPFAER